MDIVLSATSFQVGAHEVTPTALSVLSLVDANLHPLPTHARVHTTLTRTHTKLETPMIAFSFDLNHTQQLSHLLFVFSHIPHKGKIYYFRQLFKS